MEGCDGPAASHANLRLRRRSGQLVRGEPEAWGSVTTLSRQLAALEKHVGAPLMVRTTRQLALTEAGRDYLETCRSILSELEAAEARLAGKDDAPCGELALTAPVVFGLHAACGIGLFVAISRRLGENGAC